MNPQPDRPPQWSEALLSLLHPVQIACVEAYGWIGLPLSAKDLFEVLGRDWPFGTVAYHVRRLADAGVLVEVGQVARRGAIEHYFRLAG